MSAQAKPARKAAAGKAAAARAEKTAQERTCTWRGLEFTLPAQLPATVAFDLADLQDQGEDFTLVLRLLRSLMGEEAITAVRRQLAVDGDSMDELGDVIVELCGEVLGGYGISLGE